MSLPEIDLSHMRVLVTGGAGEGVGAGVCEALAACGATLLINDLEEEDILKAVAKYPNAKPAKADISVPAQVNALFEELYNSVGPVNGLVNNAGVGLSRKAHEADVTEFDHLYGIDIRGVWLVSRIFAQRLLADGLTGNIVNVSSVHARATQPRYALYASAKAAVEGLTRGMAIELGPHGIRCNAIGPGLVHSGQNEDLIRTWTDDPAAWIQDFIDNQQVLHFPIQPVDCGQVAAFLLSDLSRAITGQTIYVDNGTTIMLFNRDFIERDR